MCFYLLIRWFTTMNQRCKPWNLEIFSERVRVYDSEPKLHGFALFYVVLELIIVLERNKEVSLWFYLVLVRRFDLDLQKSLDLILLLILAWILRWNWWFSPSSSELVRIPWIFLSLFFSILLLWSHLDSLLPAMNLVLELQKWRLSDEDSPLNLWELSQFPLISLAFNSGKS